MARRLHRLMEAYPSATDLVREILLPSLANAPIRAHLFDGYWEDLGTIKSYHRSSPGPGQRSAAV